MLSVVFVTTEPVIDVLIDSPWRNKPIEARLASSRKCSTRKRRANTNRRFYKHFQELILKILRLCNERMFKNIDYKSATSLFYCYNEVRSWRGDRKITREASAKEKSSLNKKTRENFNTSRWYENAKHFSSIFLFDFSLLRAFFNSLCLERSRPLPYVIQRARKKKAGNLTRLHISSDFNFGFLKVFYLRLSFRYLISWRRIKKLIFTNSSSQREEWTDDLRFSPCKRRRIDFVASRYSKSLALETTILDIVHDSLTAPQLFLQMQNVFPARELYNSNPWWVLQLYFNIFVNFEAFQAPQSNF